jgi:predicted DNA-binding WGR domain protein/tetratricopeptide (TPR) repeat protein
MKKRFTNYRSDKFWQIEVAGNSLVTTYWKRETLGKTAVNNFESERSCLREAEVLMVDKKRHGYVETVEDFIKRTELPEELRDARSRKRTIAVQGRKFILFPLQDIMLTSVIVNAGQAFQHNGHGRETCDGFYCHTAYALGCEVCEEEEPSYFLVWLPDIDLYGLWSRSSYALYVFPGMSWSDIEKRPSSFVDPGLVTQSFPMVQDHLTIEDNFVFVPSDLDKQVSAILSMPDNLRHKKVEEFLIQYEYRLLSLAYSSELEKAFSSLVTMYYHIGQWLEGDSEYAKAIKWFERSLLILNQAPSFRTLFSDIFLQLSFCYLETSKFDLALLYIDIFALFDPSSRNACHKIKESIQRTQQLYKDTMSVYLRNIEQESQNGYEEASSVIKRAIESAPHDPVLHFNLACFYASSNRANEAFYHLEEAFKKGYKDYEKLLNERDLENIRYTTEFEDMRLRYLFITR